MRFQFSLASIDIPHAQRRSSSPEMEMNAALSRVAQWEYSSGSDAPILQDRAQDLAQISGFLRSGEGAEAAAYYDALQLADARDVALWGVAAQDDPAHVMAASQEAENADVVHGELEPFGGLTEVETVRPEDLMVPFENRIFFNAQQRQDPVLPLGVVSAEEDASGAVTASGSAPPRISASPVSAPLVSDTAPLKAVRKRKAKTGVVSGVSSRKNAKLDLSTLSMNTILGSPGHLARATKKQVSDWLILQSTQPLKERHDFLVKLTEFNDKRLHHNLFNAIETLQGHAFLKGEDPSLVKSMDDIISKLDTAKLDDSVSIEKATEYTSYFNNSGADIISDWLLLRSNSSFESKITLLNKIHTGSGKRTKQKMATALHRGWSGPFLKANDPADEKTLRSLSDSLISAYALRH